MTAPYEGRCNCGAVTLRIEAEPMWVRQCWCRQCQKAAAGSPTNNALFATETLTTTGEIGWWGYAADSGSTVEHGFCPACATPIASRNAGRDRYWVLRLGVFEGDHGLAPQAAIWLDEAPDWACVDTALERFDRQPPIPGKAPATGRAPDPEG